MCWSFHVCARRPVTSAQHQDETPHAFSLETKQQCLVRGVFLEMTSDVHLHDDEKDKEQMHLFLFRNVVSLRKVNAGQ